MNPVIDRMKIFFLGVFALACVAVWTYELVWAVPAKKCESQGNWWDGQSRICATPIYLPNLTGRPATGLTPAQLKARAQQANAKEAVTLGAAPASAKPAP